MAAASFAVMYLMTLKSSDVDPIVETDESGSILLCARRGVAESV